MDNPERGQGFERSPWDRGGQAQLVKGKVHELLGPWLIEWATTRERAVIGSTVHDVTLFEADARELVSHQACQPTIAEILSFHPSASCADVEAAIVSVYVNVLWTHCSKLLSAYVCCVARKLRHILRTSLKTIRLDMDAEDENQDIAVPMSLFFFDSLRTCQSDPNCFRSEVEGEKKLVTRPFGWSPDHDSLDSLLALLLTRQAGDPFRPQAFNYSPLAYYLRSAGFATVVRVEQAACQSCKGRYHQHVRASSCPQCGGRLKTQTVKMLLSTRHVEDVLRQVASGQRDLPPTQTILSGTARGVAARRNELDEARRQREELDGTWRQVFDHARTLWYKIVHSENPNPCELAVLFSLADLNDLPQSTWQHKPRDPWLQQMVATLLEATVPRDKILQWSEVHMAEVCRVFGATRQPKLKPGNVGRIVFRFRKAVFQTA